MLVLAGDTQEVCEDALSEASAFGEAEAVRILVSSEMLGPDAMAHALVTASSRGFDDIVVILLQMQSNISSQLLIIEPWKRLWKSWVPGKCKLFLWLAIRNRCWTADRLAKRGLPHPAQCVFCDQEEENVQHILATCVFTRQFWFTIFSSVNLQNAAPRHSERSFADWWRRAARKIGKNKRKGVNSMIILGAWILWKHRNRCVFDGMSPCLQLALREFKDEAHCRVK